MKEKFILQSDIINNNSLSAEATCVYIALRAFCSKGDNEYFISNSKLEYYLFGNKMGRNEHLAMNKGLKDLIDNKYISISQKLSSTEYIYNCSLINPENINKYFYAYKNDIWKIMNLDVKYNKYKMLKYYMCLLSSFYNNRNENDQNRMKIGLLSQIKISKLAGLSIPTINEYNDVLEKANVLYILKTIQSSTIDKIPKRQNIYARYEDRNMCDQYCIERNIKTNLRSKIDESDQKKRDIEIYKNICKGKKYDPSIVQRVYDTMSKLNDSIILGEKDGEEYDNIFDLSIFNK